MTSKGKITRRTSARKELNESRLKALAEIARKTDYLQLEEPEFAKADLLRGEFAYRQSPSKAPRHNKSSQLRVLKKLFSQLESVENTKKTKSSDSKGTEKKADNTKPREEIKVWPTVLKQGESRALRENK